VNPVKHLVDTDWTISFLNGRAQAAALFERLADEGVAISIITWGEVYEGLVGASVPVARIAEFEAFLSTIELITLDTEIARRYGEIRAHLRAAGQLLADNDLWIAATALAHGLDLVTRDRHFSRVPGLMLLPDQKS
jgi:tRNA(fMet)-specific endonuclease VapC